MDEIWIHHFTLESNWQSAVWTAAGESHPKQPKTQTSSGKVLASIIWDVQGILFIDYLEKGRTINSDGLMSRVFTNGQRDQGSISGRVIPKTKKNGT